MLQNIALMGSHRIKEIGNWQMDSIIYAISIGCSDFLAPLPYFFSLIKTIRTGGATLASGFIIHEVNPSLPTTINTSCPDLPLPVSVFPNIANLFHNTTIIATSSSDVKELK